MVDVGKSHCAVSTYTNTFTMAITITGKKKNSNTLPLPSPRRAGINFEAAIITGREVIEMVCPGLSHSIVIEWHIGQDGWGCRVFLFISTSIFASSIYRGPVQDWFCLSMQLYVPSVPSVSWLIEQVEEAEWSTGNAFLTLFQCKTQVWPGWVET